MRKKHTQQSRRQDLVTFGRRLKIWRKAKGWSQEQLALAARLDYSYVNEIENGKLNPGLLTILILAQALDVSPAVFLISPETARQLQETPAFLDELSEQRFINILKQSDLIEIHCQLIEHYLKNHYFDTAKNCLDIMMSHHPEHWRLEYLLARYYWFEVDERLNKSPFALAESHKVYRVKKSAGSITKMFDALQRALQNPDPLNCSREWLKQDPDLMLLQDYYPDEWRQLNF